MASATNGGEHGTQHNKVNRAVYDCVAAVATSPVVFGDKERKDIYEKNNKGHSRRRPHTTWRISVARWPLGTDDPVETSIGTDAAILPARDKGLIAYQRYRL